MERRESMSVDESGGKKRKREQLFHKGIVFMIYTIIIKRKSQCKATQLHLHDKQKKTFVRGRKIM